MRHRVVGVDIGEEPMSDVRIRCPETGLEALWPVTVQNEVIVCEHCQALLRLVLRVEEMAQVGRTPERE